MATPSKGVGRGVGGGGRRNGAGRPPGAINRKARELIAQAERENLQTPLDFLLDIMRDPSQELRDRILCATASAPYMHSKRSVVRVIAEPEELNDVQLVKQVEAYERIAAARPEPERAASLGVQLRHLIEDAKKLRPPRRAEFYGELVDAACVFRSNVITDSGGR